jgi:hypothetical protein
MGLFRSRDRQPTWHSARQGHQEIDRQSGITLETLRQMVRQGGTPSEPINPPPVEAIGMTSMLTANARATDEGQLP